MDRPNHQAQEPKPQFHAQPLDSIGCSSAFKVNMTAAQFDGFAHSCNDDLPVGEVAPVCHPLEPREGEVDADGA